ncbi:hypothetical protein HanIR_Chr13g0652261 [Helianthus annuus]|nr:hypothetical protein HanIR_Chr13g0652261 [Helianthus annuus]
MIKTMFMAKRGFGNEIRDGMDVWIRSQKPCFLFNRQRWAYRPNGSNGGDNTI